MLCLLTTLFPSPLFKNAKDLLLDLISFSSGISKFFYTTLLISFSSGIDYILASNLYVAGLLLALATLLPSPLFKNDFFIVFAARKLFLLFSCCIWKSSCILLNLFNLEFCLLLVLFFSIFLLPLLYSVLFNSFSNNSSNVTPLEFLDIIGISSNSLEF